MTKYEYMTSQGAIDFKPIATTMSGNDLAKDLTRDFGKVIDDLQKLIPEARGGGWEVVSHSLLLLGNHLIVSFLLRRDLRKKRGHQ
jgi:hypothetical protein